MPEHDISNAVLLQRLDDLLDETREIKSALHTLNGTVRQHEVRVTVLESFCQEQVKPALGQLQTMRLELAKFSAFGGIGGLVVMVLYGLGKLAQWW